MYAAPLRESKLASADPAFNFTPGAEFKEQTLDSQVADAYRAVMSILEQDGQRVEEVEKLYQEAQELGLKDPVLHNTLAWMLATAPEPRNRNPRRAVELAEKAVKAAPMDGGYWNTLGVAQYRAGNWQGALTALRKSIELRKDKDAYDFFFLAMAHWKLSEQEQARSWYGRAVEWIEKNRQGLQRNQRVQQELKRIRAEAEEVLKVKKD